MSVGTQLRALMLATVHATADAGRSERAWISDAVVLSLGPLGGKP